MSTSRYFNLAIGAPARLAAMRKAFAEHSTRYPHCPDASKPARVLDIRGTTFDAVESYCGALSQGVGQWHCHTGPQFRNERDAHEIVERLPRGWYTDSECSDTAIGIVAGLPHGRFIAGYRWTSNDERVYFPELHDDESDAAHAANGHAELFAESAREDSEKYDTARDLEAQNEDALTRLRECLVLRHKACMVYVREEVADLCATIRNNRARLQNEFSDYL